MPRKEWPDERNVGNIAGRWGALFFLSPFIGVGLGLLIRWLMHLR